MRDGISLKATGDRQVYAPYGLEGGHPGECGSFYRCYEGVTTRMPSKSTGNAMRKGEIVIANTPGAGGFGDPLLRETQKVLEDVENDYVSLEKARSEYGVVIIRCPRADMPLTTQPRKLYALRCAQTHNQNEQRRMNDGYCICKKRGHSAFL